MPLLIFAMMKIKFIFAQSLCIKLLLLGRKKLLTWKSKCLRDCQKKKQKKCLPFSEGNFFFDKECKQKLWWMDSQNELSHMSATFKVKSLEIIEWCLWGNKFMILHLFFFAYLSSPVFFCSFLQSDTKLITSKVSQVPSTPMLTFSPLFVIINVLYAN